MFDESGHAAHRSGYSAGQTPAEVRGRAVVARWRVAQGLLQIAGRRPQMETFQPPPRILNARAGGLRLWTRSERRMLPNLNAERSRGS